MKNLIIIIVTLLLFNSCKKSLKDQISVVNIKGNVKNNCTDSGWANVTVHLNTNNNGSSNQISTVTDSRGDFVFSNVSINNNSDYTYTVSIDNLDHYIGGVPPGDYGHTGVSGEINKDSPGNFLHLGIQGTFYNVNFHLPNGTYINPPDTIKIKMNQPVFHRNMPPNVWQIDLGAGTNVNYTQINEIGNFPMGMWHLYITTIKSGVTTYVHDSIYLDMGCNANYNILW